MNFFNTRWKRICFLLLILGWFIFQIVYLTQGKSFEEKYFLIANYGLAVLTAFSLDKKEIPFFLAILIILVVLFFSFLIIFYSLVSF